MRRCQYSIRSRDVHDHAAALCQKHLRLTDHGPKCTAPTILAILFYAASRLTSLAAACLQLIFAPSAQALDNALAATLPALAELQRRLNRALQGDLPKALRRRRQPIAIDLVLLPYHGQPLHDAREVYRGQARSGTTHFHAYATAYLMRKGQRFTVGLVYVRQGDALGEVIKELLHQAAKAGVRPRYLLLDRGFYSVAVIRYLQRARVPFLMPLPCKGRKADHPEGPSSTRVFHLRQKSGWGQHTLKNPRGQTATVRVCVKRKRGGKPKGKWATLVYAFWGLEPSSYQWLYQTYRLRFGIETTYRQLQQARIRTSTRDPLLRLLYVGIALILRNVWVWLHWQVLSGKRRGYRKIELERLTFQTMLVWLQHVAEELLGVCDARFTERPAPT
jgi:putative transposase